MSPLPSLPFDYANPGSDNHRVFDAAARGRRQRLTD
jgi:hypothetical protein